MRRGDGSVTNIAEEPVVAYALSLVPTGGEENLRDHPNAVGSD